MVMLPVSYKVFADIGTKNVHSVRTITIIDTGAGPNCIRKDKPPIRYYPYLKPGLPFSICDDTGNRIDMHGVVTLHVELGGYGRSLEFIIGSRLKATCIICTNVCGRFLKAIRPKFKSVELDNGPSSRQSGTRGPQHHYCTRYECKTAPSETSSPQVRADEQRKVP